MVNLIRPKAVKTTFSTTMLSFEQKNDFHNFRILKEWKGYNYLE
jgi:hypothetical protein